MRHQPRLSELRECEFVPFDRAEYAAQLRELDIPGERVLAEVEKAAARHDKQESERVVRAKAWVERIRREGVPSSAKPAGMLWNASH